jgi:putative PEP-CTERM system TPR-repeat lipoprotein
MKKLVLFIVVLLVLGGGGAAAWYKFGRKPDPFASAKALMDKGDLKAAQIELRNSLREDPNNAEAHFRLAVLQARTGDPVAAEKEFRLARDNGFDQRAVTPLLAQTYMAQGKFKELLKDFPTDKLPAEQAGPLTVMRGMAQLQLNDLDAALATFTEAEKLSPNSADPLLSTARVLIVKRDYPAAEAKVDRALAMNAKSPEALVLKGQLLNLAGDRQKALTTLDSALELAPNTLAARLERANILIATNNDAKAKEDVDFVLRAEPRSAGGVYLQGVLAARAKDFQGADAAFTKIIAILPRFPRGYYFQAIVKFNLGQAEQAADAAGKYVARNPSDIDGVKLLARIDLAMQRPDHAEENLTRAVAAGIADADILDLLGRAYAQGGKQVLALQMLEKAAQLAPDNADILARLAAARLGLGDAGGAARDLEHSLELAPQRNDTGEALVVAALAAGDVARANAALDKVRKGKSDPAVVGILTGMVKMAQLDFEGARGAFAGVLRSQPQSVPARLNLARISALQGKPGEAESMLGEILRQDPANEQALSNLLGILLADGRVSRAIAVVEAGRAVAPANVSLIVTLADLYVRNRDGKKALELIDATQKNQAPNRLLQTARVRALISAGLTKDAIETMRQIVGAAPTDVQARRGLADLMMQNNDVLGAKTSLRDGLKLMPGNVQLLQALTAVDLQVAGPDVAVKTIEDLAKDPVNADGLRGLRGDVLMAGARYSDAARAYETELEKTPSVALVLRLATALTAAGKPEDANKLLADTYAKQPDNLDIAQVLAANEIGVRNTAAAEKLLNVVLEKAPNNVVALNNLAWLYQQKSDPRARDIAQRAYLLGPSPQVADTLGWILATQGEPATGLPLLRQASNQLPNDPTVQFHFGATLKALGQVDQATSVLRPIVLGKAEYEDRPAAEKMYRELTGGQ